jgi:hypothetical protein
VRRSVFDRLQSTGPFEKIAPFSEDHSFFLRCLNAGIDCYAAMDIHANHLRVIPVTEDDLPKPGELMESALFPVGGFS